LACCSVGVIIPLPLTLNRNASKKFLDELRIYRLDSSMLCHWTRMKTFQRKNLETKFCNSVTS
jgi:hypothetical protein